MLKSPSIKRNSPLFGDLVSWIERKRTRQLRAFFPLDGYSTWRRIAVKKHVVLRRLDDWRRVISQDLVEPLFLNKGLKVQDEDSCRQHRKGNLVCCLEYHRGKLKGAAGGDLERTLKEFRADFQKAAPRLGFPSWLIDGRDPLAEELGELEKKQAELDATFRRFIDENSAALWNDEIENEYEPAERALGQKRADAEWARKQWVASSGGKQRYAIYFCDQVLWRLKFARGKRGRQPEPFNVLVYHLIKMSTRPKWAQDQSGPIPLGFRPPNYLYRKDGQRKLETDWALVLFLLLDLHLHAHRLPALAKFISAHRNEPVAAALKKLQTRLLGIYKNFPRIHGWPMNREGFPEPETGYRKAIVTDDGALRIVQL